MAGRDLTCGAPRFRRALYRAELRPHVSRRGWTRTSSLLCVRQALCALELLALERSEAEIRDKGSNLGFHFQSVASCRLDDPGKERALRPHRGCGVDAAALLWYVRMNTPNDVVYATRLPFDPGSPRCGVLRGGALEPEPRTLAGKRTG